MKGGTGVARIKLEELLSRGTGARRGQERDPGFRPAFLDFATQRIYLSCYPNGLAARTHVLDGLPDEVITERSRSGRVLRTKATLIAGFVRNGFFFTQRAAAKAAAEWK